MSSSPKHEISQKSLGRALSTLVILIFLFLAFSPLTKTFASLGKGLFYLFGLLGPYFLCPIALVYGIISLVKGEFPKHRGARTLIGLGLIYLALSSLSSHIAFGGKESLDYTLFSSTYDSLSSVECFYSKEIGGGVIGYYLASLSLLGGKFWFYLILSVCLIAALVIIFFPEIKKLFAIMKGKRAIANSKKKEAEKARNNESIARAKEAREAANQPIYTSAQPPFEATPVSSAPLKESTFVSSVPLPPPFVSSAPKKVISEDETPLPSRLDLYGEKPKNPVPEDITDETTRRHTPSTPATYFYESGLQEAKFVPSREKEKPAQSPSIVAPKEEPEAKEPAQNSAPKEDNPTSRGSGSREINTQGLFMNESPVPSNSVPEASVSLFMQEPAYKEEAANENKIIENEVATKDGTEPLIPNEPQAIEPIPSPKVETPMNKEEIEASSLSNDDETIEPTPAPSIFTAPSVAQSSAQPVEDTTPLEEEAKKEETPIFQETSNNPVPASETKVEESQEEVAPASLPSSPANETLQKEAPSPIKEDVPLPKEEPEEKPVIIVAPKVDPNAQPEAKPLPPYTLPGVDLLKDYPSVNEHKAEQIAECEARKDLINQIFDGFKAGAHVVNYTVGPSVTRYNILTEPNVTVSSINRYIQDISVRLGGVPTRYEEIVMGQSYSGLEIANRVTTMVSLKDTIKRLPPLSPKTNLVIPFGESISGDYISSDLSEFPHMLISGSTGSGKSVFMHGLIMSLIMRNRPEELKLVMVDPKRVEMGCYKDIPHLLCPIIKEPSQAKVCFQKLITEMERRYGLFDKSGVRNIREFNGEYAAEHNLTKLPFIVVIVDEFADLADSCKDIGEYVVRIAQKARAAGIHLVIATQRPTVDVITGTIKANLACRVALSVASAQDSMTILGQGGAEELAGHGDMLLDCSQVLRNGFIRAQGCYVDTHEINNVTNFIRNQMGPQYDSKFLDLVDHDEEEKQAQEAAEANAPSKAELRAAQGDDFYEMVKETIMSREYTSISRIQREFGVGFPRAGKIFARLQSEGIVAQDPDTASSSKGCRVIKHDAGGSGVASPSGGDNQ